MQAYSVLTGDCGYTAEYTDIIVRLLERLQNASKLSKFCVLSLHWSAAKLECKHSIFDELCRFLEMPSDSKIYDNLSQNSHLELSVAFFEIIGDYCHKNVIKNDHFFLRNTPYQIINLKLCTQVKQIFYFTYFSCLLIL